MNRFAHWARLLSFAGLILIASTSRAAEADVNANTSSGATEDAAAALRRFRAAPGMKIELFAAEPMLQNVVSFAFDEQGRCYAVESNRRRTSVFDIRGLTEWLDTDFSFRTVDERAAFLRKTFSPANPALPDLLKSKRNLLSDFNHDGAVDWHDLEVQEERIRLLVDTNFDGHADVSATLAEGFNGITSGVAAGVLARHGEVWFACIPDLWKLTIPELRVTNGIPSAASIPLNPHRSPGRSQLVNVLSGFGVHIAFGGHDLHGLKLGPDGKIYFSIADRGTGTNLWGRIADKWPGLTMEALADSGAVFRCNRDGSDFEVVCVGLRNPQELAFDEFGHLFAGDNNGDGGDKARWIYVVEGADYGWRMGWQWLPKMGAWNSEMLWGLAGTNTSAYHLPPVAHIGAGPAGVTYYPGTGLPARYDGHFFMCDFRGGPNSVVRSFAVRPKGASFEAFDESEFLSGPLCTDVDFGVDGAVYVSDWVKGWDKTDKGRIYRVFDPQTINDPGAREVRTLLSGGSATRPTDELIRLLGHRDMRVRLEAQWELADRCGTKEVARALLRRAAESSEPLAQRHAIWALNQTLGRPGLVEDAAVVRLISAISTGKSPNRAQAVRMLGNAPSAVQWTKDLCGDADPAVQFSALQAMARSIPRLSPTERQQFARVAIPAILHVLRTSGHDDYLRHAAVFALARLNDVPALLAAAQDESASVRLGVCLALRRLQRPEVARFLRDHDRQIALEAARAIYDGSIPEAMTELTAVNLPLPAPATSADARLSAALSRRILNAHFRLGAATNASALAQFAASTAPDDLRVEAIELLGLWATPPARDHVVGLWRPLPARNVAAAADALNGALAAIQAGASPSVKVAAKKALATLVKPANGGGDDEVNQVARLSQALKNGSLAEKQGALAALAKAKDKAAAKILSAWLDRLIAGDVAKELRLDVIEAAQQSPGLATSRATKEKLARLEASRDAKDALAKWRECLYGGNAEEGKRTFVERQDAACFRCHKVQGEGGEVGPELAGIGQKHTREYILESILFPNRAIAPGFENVVVTMKDGTSYAGLLKEESATELTINSGEDGLVTVKKANVKSRDRGLSAMPEEMANILTKRDLRNLVEFLSTLK